MTPLFSVGIIIIC